MSTMEKKEYESPSLEVTEMGLEPVLQVMSQGQHNEEGAAPPFTGSFDGSDDEDGGRRKARGGYQGDDDVLVE